jgi:hypothetical protein
MAHGHEETPPAGKKRGVLAKSGTLIIVLGVALLLGWVTNAWWGSSDDRQSPAASTTSSAVSARSPRQAAVMNWEARAPDPVPVETPGGNGYSNVVPGYPGWNTCITVVRGEGAYTLEAKDANGNWGELNSYRMSYGLRLKSATPMGFRASFVPLNSDQCA